MSINYRRAGSIIIGGIIMISGIGIVVAQLPSEDGLGIVREIYADLLKSFETDACRIHYTTTTISIQNGQPVAVSADIEYLATSDRMQCVSNDYAMYGDTTVAVAVIEDRKTIVITPSSSDELRGQQQKMVDQVREAFFSDGKTIGWKKIDPTDSLRSNRVLVVKPSERVTRLTLIDTVTIYLNENDRTLQKVRMSYVDNSGIDAIEMQYGPLERVDSPEEFERPVLQTFFDENNRLVPQYAGYTVRDMRAHQPRFPKRTK